MTGDDLIFAADRLDLDATKHRARARNTDGFTSAGNIALAERCERLSRELRDFAPRIDLIHELIRFEDGKKP